MVALVLVFCTALVLAQPSAVRAQDGDAIAISTEMTLTAVDSLEGSGDVRYEFTGTQATALRLAVFSTFDFNGDKYVDASEALRFLAALGGELEGKQLWGVTIEDATNYSAMTESQVTNRTTGLVGSVPSSEGPVSFSFDFGASGESVRKLIRLSELSIQTLLGSVEEVTGTAFVGTLEISDRVVLFGVANLASPDLVDGDLAEFRTPMGSIMWYSLTTEVGGANPPPSETVTYESFNVLENQQVIFVALLVGCILVLRVPAKRFEKYRLEHPKKFRKSAKPLPTVRAFSWAMIALLCVLYLFPFLFSFADRNLLLAASYQLFLIPAAIAGTYVFTRAMYSVASLKIPEDVVVEVKQAVVSQGGEAVELRCQVCMMPLDAELDLHQCASCGSALHVACAHRAQTCPQCGEVLFPEQTRSVECKACGETFLTSLEEDPFALQCTRCGAFQEEIKAGQNYLVVDVDGKRAYNMLRSMGLTGRPSMVLTSEFPGKVREENGLGDDFEVKWLTGTTGDIDSVGIKDLEGDAMETVSTFLMTTKRSGLLLDGIEAIISENGFDAALAFIRRLNDLAAIHGASIIMWYDRGRLPEAQDKALSDEFDEVHDYL
ncbi:MAG: DUF835 domain-containing protein [Candidatus Thermoplasmatota archaeon]